MNKEDLEIIEEDIRHHESKFDSETNETMKMLSQKITEDLKPFVVSVMIAKNEISEQFADTMLESAIGSLMLSLKDSVDGSLNILENVRKHIIHVDKKITKRD